MSLINWALIKNPLNWITVFLMTAFAAIALSMILPADGAGSQT